MGAEEEDSVHGSAYFRGRTSRHSNLRNGERIGIRTERNDELNRSGFVCVLTLICFQLSMVGKCKSLQDF